METTVFQICISPSAQDFQETKCSLNFGQRARKVRNKAYINMEVDYKKLSEHLMKQIDMKGKSFMNHLYYAHLGEGGGEEDNGFFELIYSLILSFFFPVTTPSSTIFLLMACRSSLFRCVVQTLNFYHEVFNSNVI